MYHYICVLTFYVLLSALFAKTSFCILRPNLDNCPVAADYFGYCESKFNDCKRKQSVLSFCTQQFCDCINAKRPSSEQECDNDVRMTCSHLRETSQKNPEKSPLKWPEEIETRFTEIGKECKRERNISVHEIYELLVSKEECIALNKPKLDVSSVELDKKTYISSLFWTKRHINLPIPFDRFRCGWQYGYIGKVLSRNWLIRECGYYAVNLNHCCAEHQNCYLNQKGQKNCDDNFGICLKNVVSKMISYRFSCASLMENLKDEFTFEPKDYAIFEKTDPTTDIDDFTGNFNEPFLNLRTEAPNSTDIKVFRLATDSLVDSDIREMFNTKIYQNGWSHRIIIDSCAMMLEICRKQEKITICLEKLKICLHDINGKTETFKVILEEFSVVVSSRLQSFVTKQEVLKMINEEKSFLTTYITPVIDIAAMLFALYHFSVWLKKLWTRCRGPVSSSLPSPSNAAIREDRSLVPIPVTFSESHLETARARSPSARYSLQNDSVEFLPSPSSSN